MVLGNWAVTKTGVGPDLTPYAQTIKGQHDGSVGKGTCQTVL